MLYRRKFYYSLATIYIPQTHLAKKKNDEYQNRVELHGSHREGWSFIATI